jgi:hypothetical protein
VGNSSAVTEDQIRGEIARLQVALDRYEAEALARSVEDHHHGLRQRIEALKQMLARA